MSGTGDNGPEMPLTGLLDDATIEAIVAGDQVDARFDQLAAFARHVRALGDGSTPPASPELQAVLTGLVAPTLAERTLAGPTHVVRTGGAAPGHPRYNGSSRSPSPRQYRRGRLATAAAKVAGLGLAAQVGLGASVAAAGVLAAGAGGVLPGPATERVRGAIEAVTPFDFGGPGAHEPARRDDSDNFGDRVSSDATGESDGNSGVDGGEISDEAPGAAHRPSTSDTGTDRAGETPAAPHLPDSTGSDSTDHPSGVDETPGATAPGDTAPGATAPDPEAPTTSTVPPSAPAATSTQGSAGGGGNSAARGG